MQRESEWNKKKMHCKCKCNRNNKHNTNAVYCSSVHGFMRRNVEAWRSVFVVGSRLYLVYLAGFSPGVVLVVRASYAPGGGGGGGSPRLVTESRRPLSDGENLSAGIAPYEPRSPGWLFKRGNESGGPSCRACGEGNGWFNSCGRGNSRMLGPMLRVGISRRSSDPGRPATDAIDCLAPISYCIGL